MHVTWVNRISDYFFLFNKMLIIIMNSKIEFRLQNDIHTVNSNFLTLFCEFATCSIIIDLFLEIPYKCERIITDRNLRLKYHAKMCERKFYHFSAKLSSKWRNYIILNNCIKIFYFKYFYRDEIILILFSPLSKLTPHSIQDDFQHVLTRRLTEFTGLLESWINYFRIWSRSEAEGMKILERQTGPNWKK